LNPFKLIGFLGPFVFGIAGIFPITQLSHAQSTTPQPVKNFQAAIAILDLNAIRREALVVKDIKTQIESFQKDLRASVKKEEDALRAANQELAKKRSILAPEAFAEERRNFEQKVVSVQRSVQQRKRALDKSQADAMLKVENALNSIIKDIAEANKINLVLRREQTILSSHSMEITRNVLEQLNSKLSKVKVKKPGK